MLVFPVDEVNEMTRGKGVILQRFKDGGLADVRVFKKARRSHLARSARAAPSRCRWRELKDWVGVRAQSGQVAPKGFPRSK